MLGSFSVDPASCSDMGGETKKQSWRQALEAYVGRAGVMDDIWRETRAYRTRCSLLLVKVKFTLAH